VVLPLPEGPTIAMNSPCSTEKLTSLSTVSRWVPLWYSLVRFVARSKEFAVKENGSAGVLRAVDGF
jgi:hypothetical protein